MSLYTVIKLEDYLNAPKELVDWTRSNPGYKIFVSPSTFRSLRVYLGLKSDRPGDFLANRHTVIYKQERVPDNRAYAIKKEV